MAASLGVVPYGPPWRPAYVQAMSDSAADFDSALDRAHEHASAWLRTVPERPVAATATYDEMLRAFRVALPDGPEEPGAVVDAIALAAEPGLTAFQNGRFHGFVVGGTLPAAMGADWLVSAWDQNSGLVAVTPAVAAAETVAAEWVLDLLGLPDGSSVGFVTGGCMATFTCLTVGRFHVLAAAGWDVQALGLQGAPRLHVVLPDERHATVDSALRYLGLGDATARFVRTDPQATIDMDDFAAALAEGEGRPTLVSLAAGNVNTGSFDPLGPAIALAHEYGAWVHVDGAFGLWAGAAPARRRLVEGVADADSWSTDAHKWLNVPYDCGIAIVRDATAHRRAMGAHAAYLIESGEGPPDPLELVPEFSRRARGVPVYAALRSLGRSGVADLVEGCCRRAEEYAAALEAMDGVEVVNDVILNQVLVRFDDDDTTTRRVVEQVLEDRVAYMSPTVFKGRAGMRISVSGWQTTPEDVQRSVQALAQALAVARSAVVGDSRA
jgi:glutamate/tyrosine decarboxylase-like PLP-dependent enzyme